MTMLLDPYRFGEAGGGGGAGAFNNGDWYNAHFQVDANGKSDGTSYTTEDSEFGRSFMYQGDAQVSGGKFVFDGAGDYLECSLSDNIMWVAGSRFTIELRDVVFNSTAGTQALISSYNAAASDRCWQLVYSGSQLILAVSENGSTTISAAYTWTPTVSTAYNITASWDGLKLRLYVDSAYVAGAAFTGELKRPTPSPLKVGASLSTGTPTNFFNGSMRAIRFTKGRARTVSETTITLPTLPFPTSQALSDSDWGEVVLLATYNDDISRIVDDSRYDWPIAKQNSIAGSSGVALADGTPSIMFNGSNQYLDLNDRAEFELGSGAHTLECFARHDTVSGVQRYITKYDTPSDRSYALGWHTNPGLQAVIASSGSSSSPSVFYSGNYTPTVDSWDHIAYCRDGSNNGRFFVEGTQSGSTVTDSINYFNGNASLRIGCTSSSGLTQFMDGYLTEIRITKAARYTAGFTASEEAFPRG